MEEKKNNIFVYITIVLVIILLGIGIGYFLYRNNDNEMSMNNATNINDVESERKNNLTTSNKDDNKLINNSVELLKDSDFLIKGIYPGLSKSEIISILGNDFTESGKDGLLYEINYINLGINIYLNTDTDISERIILYNDKTVAVRGLKISSSINDVINSFNDDNMQIYYIKDGKFYNGLYNGNDKDIIQYVEIGFKGFIRYEWTETNKILFEFKNNKVSNITIGHGAE